MACNQEIYLTFNEFMEGKISIFEVKEETLADKFFKADKAILFKCLEKNKFFNQLDLRNDRDAFFIYAYLKDTGYKEEMWHKQKKVGTALIKKTVPKFLSSLNGLSKQIFIRCLEDSLTITNKEKQYETV